MKATLKEYLGGLLMKRNEAITVLLTKPGTKLTHLNFDPDEYIYSDESGVRIKIS